VEDAEALAEQLPPGRADLLLWPSLVGHDPALMAAQGWPDYLPLAQAVARRSAATVLQCNWPWALNNPESRHAGESAVIGPDGALLLRLPRDAAGLALFNLGETDFDWLPQTGAQHPGDSPADGAPLYFSHPAGFRDWLQAQGTTARSLLVGFHKVGSGTPAMRWPESVDEALCVGWIDGVRTRVDAQRYTIRFTPRKPGSHWSAVNVARMAELIAAGRVSPAGLAAWAQRDAARTARASYEQPGMPSLPPQAEAEFRTHPQAWAWFSAQAPSYRKKVIWNLLKAKQPATAARHLARLIEASAQQRRL
jgi:uncharacterized protein YdeI (YjbR/CyaY-like superfamily)